MGPVRVQLHQSDRKCLKDISWRGEDWEDEVTHAEGKDGKTNDVTVLTL